MTGWRQTLLVFVGTLFNSVHAHAAERPVDFAREVAPILQRSCLSCHSPENEKGDVSLATIKDLKDGEYVVAGDPNSSYLLEVVTAADAKKPAMPKDGAPLSAQQVELLRRWIAQGAQWPDGMVLKAPVVSDLDWWSLKPLKRPAVPVSEASNPVDRFIDARLHQHHLEPVEQADPITLIRRVTYDLTGLPPTPDEIDQFLNRCRTSPESAWSELVDRLLASPAFGEKWARHWLDVARYAETQGYDKDKPRNNAWPYRDYVIDSFNEDKPYDRFVREQVAGDVLFPGRPDGVLGLGFLAAGPWDFIGHWEVGEKKLDGRIAKHLDRDEMVSAVFNVFMSTTVQCAQCHHHKFDPVRMEDYYRLHAVFAAVDRADRVYDGLPLPQRREKQRLQTALDALKDEQRQVRKQVDAKLKPRVSAIDERIAQLEQEHGVPQPVEFGYHSQIVTDQNAQKWVQVDLGRSRPISRIRLIPAYDNYNSIGAGFGFPARYRIDVSDEVDFTPDKTRVVLDATDADRANPKLKIVSANVDGIRARYVRVTATKLALRSNDYIFALGELEVFDSLNQSNLALGAKVSALDSIEAPLRWAKSNLTDGITYRRLSDPVAVEELIRLSERRSEIEREIHSPAVEKQLKSIAASIADVKSQLDGMPEGRMVFAAATHFQGGGQFLATKGKPRPIHLLDRGDLRSPKEEMAPGAPPLWKDAPQRFTDSPSWDEGQARAALARYLTRPDNPLVWRSIANRLWQWVFGTPLVGTPNDFGRMGMKPTHPELLDYLAARLRDDPKHSLKAIIRLLVTSKTYRRSSTGHAGNSALDAANANMWRFHRRRLTAEEFRDSVLAISGTLRIEDRGGPSFRDFVIEKPEHSPHYEYHLHDPNDPASHRRTIYRFVVRSQPQPMLTTLDCADPSLSVPMRDESTTALQALTQWNNRLVEAMAKRFAERILREAPESPESQLERACRLALGRLPEDAEHTILLNVLKDDGAAVLARVLMNMSAFTYVD